MISGNFDQLARGSMFPDEVEDDDYALGAVLDWLGDVRGLSMVDVGCARGRYIRALRSRGARVVGVDRSWNLLRSATGNVGDSPLILSTATRLPFQEGSLDALICLEVIEHLPEPARAFAEMARVLKPGGRAVIVDKNPLGLGFHGLYPNWLYKKMMEVRGRWPYPRDFPFQERWPTSWSVRRLLRSLFADVKIRYLDGRVKGRRARVLSPLFRALPIARPDVAWCCQKRPIEV